jgi:hypothetical protein
MTLKIAKNYKSNLPVSEAGRGSPMEEYFGIAPTRTFCQLDWPLIRNNNLRVLGAFAQTGRGNSVHTSKLSALQAI